MTAKYWIKLYHETLHDPKMGRLSDHLYRRCIEIFLLAGEYDQGGLLPQLDDMAWTLRADPDNLAQDLHALADVNIAHWTEDGWVVTHFAERQDADNSAERMRQLRKRKQHATYSGDASVTNRNTDIDKIRIDTDTDTEERREESGAVQAAYNPPPEPPPHVHSERDAERVFQVVTGMVTFPATSRDKDIDRIQAIASRHNSKTVDFLKPFYSEWTSRGYSKSNTNWLDWAVSGEIPKRRNDNKPKSAAERREEANAAAFAQAREELANGKRW